MTTLSDIVAPSNLLTIDNTKTVTNKTISGASNTIDNLNASNLASGTVATARLASGTADATTYLRGDQTWVASSTFDNLNASNLSSGTVATARLASGTANATTYLRGDQTWAAAGLNYFVDSQSTASPNNIVYVHSLTASGGSTNVDVAFVAKGSGATLAQIPDNSGAAGNKRGVYATDWQKNRNINSQVASGDYSTIAGGVGNTASGFYSFASGYYNNASNTGSVGIGRSNAPTGLTATAIGYANDATNSYSVAFGYDNTASGQYSVGIGRQNNASAIYATALGYLNTATGAGSVAIGAQTIASGSYAVALGMHVEANANYSTALNTASSTKSRYCSLAVGSYPYATAPGTTYRGHCQYSLLSLGVQTTDATQTELVSIGNTISSRFFLLTNNTAIGFTILIVGAVTAAGDTKIWEVKGGIKRGSTAASTAIVGSITKNVIAADAGASTWDVDVTADTTTGYLKVEVTGAASTTIRWTATIQAAEVGF